jgi:uncharacterized OB-fold protein
VSAQDAAPLAIPFVPAAERLLPHLEGLRRGELRITRCTACGRAQFPPRAVCPGCATVGRWEWITASGRARLWSFCVFHKAYLPEPAPQPPYAVAVVRLEEGASITSSVVGVPPDRLRIDMPLLAVPPGDDDPLLRFRPADLADLADLAVEETT